MAVAEPPVRLGVLGGVFDPPHLGHVALARTAIERFGLARLLVLVVADPGHKLATTPAEARLLMTRLAFADMPGVDIELDAHPRTVDSLEARKTEEAIFIVGADEFADFPHWKEPSRILELVRLGVAMRPGVPDGRLREARDRVPAPDRVTYFEMEPVPVSSSDVRERVAHGESIDDLVPARVVAAIDELLLYRDAE